MKKGKFSSKKLLALALYSATVVGTVGAISGTFAWYSYNNFTYVEFSGTSIAETEALEIGFVSDTDIDTETVRKFDDSDDTTFGDKYENTVTKETVDGKVIYWAGAEIYDSLLSDFLGINSYATNEMSPVTSGAYHYVDATDALALKANPAAGTQNRSTSKTVFNSTAADTGDYVYLPLAFRAKEVNSASYQEGTSISLKKVLTSATGTIDKAIRIHAVNPDATYTGLTKGNGVIFDPNNTDDKDLPVAGLLNLDAGVHNNFFDATTALAGADAHKEVIYGELDGTPTWASAVTAEDSAKYYTVVGDETDVESTDQTGATTFSAKHQAGVYAVESFTAKTAKTLGTDNIYDVELTKTGGSTKGYIGYLNLTMWIEGWDLNVVDAQANNPFAIALQFQA